jgi:hypothetical protein
VLWLIGQCGIANASNVLEWMTATLLDPDPAFLEQCYNMLPSTAGDLNFYFFDLLKFAQNTYAHNLFAQNGGVKREQSAFDWLFNTVDPLVYRLSPSQANINYFHNITWEETRHAALVDIMFTGKGTSQKFQVMLYFCVSRSFFR